MSTTVWIPLFVIGTVVLVSLLALAARRLLGLRVGLLRTVLAGTIGVLAESLFGTSVRLDGHPAVQLSLQLGIGVLIATCFLAVAEAVVPSGSLGGPLDWLRSGRTRIARARRYARIMSIAVRHGLGPHLRGRGRSGRTTNTATLARALRGALEEGGVTFVKLGQVIATRHDLLAEEFVTELAHLHHDVGPVPWEDVRAVLVAELGPRFDTRFARIEPEPVAAGSIAQVHRATLHTGERVAVKIQRPGIREVVDRDLDIVRRLARSLTTRTRWGRAIGLADLADGFASALREELDFRVEARNTAAVRAADPAHGDGTVALPAVHERLSGTRVLTLGWLDGVPLGSAAPLVAERGLDPEELARTLLDCVLRQIVVDGLVHADPHPGNVLLLADDRLALLDFGSVARLDTGLRAGLQHLLLAVNAGDPAALRDALLEVVHRPGDLDERRLERVLGRFLATNVAHGGAADMGLFADLLALTADFGLEVPPEVAALFRTLLTLDGTLSGLTSEFNLIDQARRSAPGFMARQFTDRSLPTAAAGEALALLPMLRRFPRRLDRITGSLERGDFSVRVRVLADERERRVVTGLLNSVLTAFLGGVTGIMGVLLLGSSGGPSVTSTVTLYQMIGYHLLVVSSVLVLRVLVLIARGHS
ncbi:ABC1 kinase family protein [Saccharomonospora saliphila]|uniref:ABC1 kinase family protein n=1 Tax=Saccharomonospora saliphila TaxID=369829 RepID=UPI000364ECE7|nr:AarF/UbiB family protein [Saccharomonospora saliphila]